MAYNADNKQCLNLTSKAKNGQLQWKAPAGHWNIITLYIGKTFQKVKRLCSRWRRLCDEPPG
ncbi:hypothetical protein NXU95_22040 [Phocaeicola vulgatus]|nr:hypothetical protein [Phocaeicola vulgatus]